MKFKKLPVVIEAERLTERREIHTREGTIVGEIGDWLLTGVEGEIYPCADSIFRKTYAPACIFCEGVGTDGMRRTCGKCAGTGHSTAGWPMADREFRPPPLPKTDTASGPMARAEDSR